MDQFPVKTAANVRLVTKSLLALNELLFTMLNMSTTNAITFKTAYKLVDFKPMFGYLFSDLITDYDYWGHLDADTILSRLIDPAFILEKHLRNYNDDGGSGVDVLSATNSMCNGPMQLYRNTRRINKLFELSRDISLVVNSTQNLGFTENHGIMRAPFPIVLRKAVIQNKVRWNRTTNTYLEDRWYFRNGAEKHMVWSPKYHLRLVWNVSGLFEQRITQRESDNTPAVVQDVGRVSGFFHLISWKYLPTFQDGSMLAPGSAVMRALLADPRQDVFISCRGFHTRQNEPASMEPCVFDKDNQHFFRSGKKPACLGGINANDNMVYLAARNRKRGQTREKRIPKHRPISRHMSGVID